jgi:hypothetical protein
MLSACHDSMRDRDDPPAFVNRETGEVLSVKQGDRVAAKWFPGIALGKLRAVMAKVVGVARDPEAQRPAAGVGGIVSPPARRPARRVSFPP